jgi:hypothetical protein
MYGFLHLIYNRRRDKEGKGKGKNTEEVPVVEAEMCRRTLLLL